MTFLPAELLSSVIAYIWQDAQQVARYDDINACSLCCRSLYHESRLWMFQSIEFRLDSPSTAPHTTQNPPRVLSRLSRLCALLQANAALGDHIAFLALQFPWDDNPETVISQQRDANVAYLLAKAKMLGHLTFESSSRREWHAIGEGVRNALLSACRSKHISTLQFSRIIHLPAHIIATSSARSIQLQDVSLRNSPTSTYSGYSNLPEVGNLEGHQTGISNLTVEYSSVGDVLATRSSAFRNLRQLHTKLAVNRETQQLIDATHITLEHLSCAGKAMVRQTGSKSSCEEAAGIGPFDLQYCHLLRSLRFSYCTPKGNVHSFSSVLTRTLGSLAPGLCLDVLEMSFQTSTSTDLIPLLLSPLWTYLENAFRNRNLFRKLRVTLAYNRRAFSRQADSSMSTNNNLLAKALDAPARLPLLIKANAIDFYINSTALYILPS